MAEDQDLKDLVDAPKEALGVEIKGELDLADDVHRANLARHICALANYGGGFIVFGFGNDLKPVALSGDVDKRFHPDRVSSIVHKYLEPTVLCDVVIVQSAAGERHPVVRVPAHDAIPICAKADGPQDKGRPQGIVSGRHYIRVVGNSGPESVVITQPEQWQSLIRRLVTTDRAALAALIARAVDPRMATRAASSVLDAWHQGAAAVFTDGVKTKKLPWPVPLIQNYFQLSYEFNLAQPERIAGGDMLAALETANAEMRNLVWTGWSMFYVFNRSETAPYFITDAYAGQGPVEVLETDLLGRTLLTSTLPDFWRVSSDGKATIVRAYREDRSGYAHPAGKTLSLFLAARELAEFISHARAMAPHFKSLTSVRIRCDWHGLQGRELRDPEADSSMSRISKANRVQSELEATPEDLTNAWPELVSQLLGRFARSFDAGLNPSPGWVRRITPRFRSL